MVVEGAGERISGTSEFQFIFESNHARALQKKHYARTQKKIHKFEGLLLYIVEFYISVQFINIIFCTLKKIFIRFSVDFF